MATERTLRNRLADMIQEVLDDCGEDIDFIAISPGLDEVCVFDSLDDVPEGWHIERPKEWPWPAYDIADMYYDLRKD